MSKSAPRMTANQVLHRLVSMTTNLLLSRTSAISGNYLDPEGRDLDKECGYPVGDPSNAVYRQLYDRVGIATRIVNVHSSESWSVAPLVYETEQNRRTKFERAFEALVRKRNVFHYLERADEQSGIFRYGIVLYGFDDLSSNTGATWEKPVRGILPTGERDEKVDFSSEKARNLLYMRPFPEDLVRIEEIETNQNSPRFNQPTIYSIRMSEPNEIPEDGSGEKTTELRVHWTRVEHLADNAKSSEIYGCPRLKPVLNYVLDARKVTGGSSEMFWRGAFPGYAFETHPELTAEAELDADSVKQEIEAYSNGLQRYMRLVGMSAKSLAPQVADPSNHLTSLLELICASIQVPLRVFLGSESAHLASVQDAVAWNRRLRKRQEFYLTPRVVRPFIDRMMMVGVLPWVDDYIVEWRDLNTIGETDRAKISLQKAQALLQYVTSGTFALVPPRMFLELVLNFTPAEATAIIEAAGGESKVISSLKEFVNGQAGNTPDSTGTNPETSTGAGGRRNGLGRAKR